MDMLRFPYFGNGAAWTDEFGDPREPHAFAWLRAYSPYHQVLPGVTYPSLLVRQVDRDERVDSMHGRKFVAALQFAQASARPVLLRVEWHGGHGGTDSRKAGVISVADELAFVWSELAMEEPETPVLTSN
jgi:prolyl oligopeptidase